MATTGTRGGRPSNAELEARAKRDAFVKLATRRVNAVLTELDKIAGYAGSPRYSFTEEDVEKIGTTISEAVATATRSLREKKNLSRDRFSL